MKKILTVICISIFLLFNTAKAVFAQDSAEEKIQNYQVDIIINSDASINVDELIRYDFGANDRHGIIRNIPVTKTNQDNKKFILDISGISVTDGKGQKYQFTSSNDSNNLSLKIGDPNRTISGIHLYDIKYTVAGALTYFSDHDELYWNLIGNDWQIPVEKSSANIIFPKKLDAGVVQYKCFTGYFKETGMDCNISYSDGIIRILTSRQLEIDEGLTSVVGFPKGIVAVVEPKEIVPFEQTLFGKIIIFIIIIIAFIWYLLVPILIIRAWWKFGRDPKPAMGETSAWFSPPKNKKLRVLTPLETGAIIDEMVDMRDIYGTLIDLARRGYLKIIETKKNKFEFHKNKDFTGDKDLLNFEHKLLSGIFGSDKIVKIEDVDLTDTVKTIKDQVYKSLVKDEFFPENPQSVRTNYIILAVLAFITFNPFLILICWIFGKNMPRKTLLGAQAAAEARSLKNFLVSQDKKLAFQAKNQMFFEKLLPYAVAFGVEKIWASRFKDIKLTAPDWYQPYNSNTFNSLIFVNALSHNYSQSFVAATAYKSSTGFSSGFSGGGFSGGGGGGGGGGSW